MDIDQPTLFKALGVGAAAGLIVAIGSNIPLVGLACCCLGPIVYIGIGAAYGYFADQEGNPVDMSTWLVAGAGTGAVAGLVSGIINAIVIVLGAALGIGFDAASTLAQLEAQGFEVPPGFEEGFAAGAQPAVAAITGICGNFFLYALLATVGALIFALVKQGQERNATSSPAV